MSGRLDGQAAQDGLPYPPLDVGLLPPLTSSPQLLQGTWRDWAAPSKQQYDQGGQGQKDERDRTDGPDFHLASLRPQSTP